MRKIHKTFLCLALIIGLCACGQKAPTWQEQYDLGVRYLSEGNYEEAIIAFTAAVEIDPKRASAYVGRGNAYVLSDEAEDNLSAAKSDYEKAIELDEMMAEAYIGLADVYIRQGDYDKALEILCQGLEKNEKDQKISDKITEMEAKLTDEQDSNLYQGIVYLTREDRVKIIHEKYNLFNDQLLGGYADYDGDGYDESEFFDTYEVYTEDGWKTMASSFYYCDHDGKFAECLANFSYATNNLNVAGSSACFNRPLAKIK